MDSSGVVPGGSSFELDRWWKPPEFHDVRTAPPSYDDAVMAYHAGEDRVDHVNNPDPGNHSIPRHQVLHAVWFIRVFSKNPVLETLKFFSEIQYSIPLEYPYPVLLIY